MPEVFRLHFGEQLDMTCLSCHELRVEAMPTAVKFAMPDLRGTAKNT